MNLDSIREKDTHQNNNNRNKHNNNNDRGDRGNNNNNNRNTNYNNNRDNRHNNNNNAPTFKTKLYKVFYSRSSSSGYESSKIKKMLCDGGLADIIKDIKRWKKDNKPRPQYALNALEDVAFVAHVKKAMKLGLKNDEFNKKDLKFLYDEIYIVLKNMKGDRRLNADRYDSETVDDMTNIYVSILNEANEKRIKKIRKNVKGMSKNDARDIAILTTSKNVPLTIYSLLDFFYFTIGKRDTKSEMMSIKNSSFIELFKTCYGKECIPSVCLALMLEGHNKRNRLTNDLQKLIWSTIDEIMREELELLSKKDIKKIVFKYIETCRKQSKINERQNKKPLRRRLGDRRNIHGEDYPKLNGVFEEVEEDDITIKRFLRNV